jgi:TonB-linked SusC/RagA family outer membrane protein
MCGILRKSLLVEIASLLFVALLWSGQTAGAQDHEVAGTVTDQKEGQSLPGVNIVVKGTNIGTSTDAQGTYALRVPSPQDTLVFSFVGYLTIEVPIEGRSTVDVQLATDVSALEELVVVGYGTQEKTNLTGSVDQISGDELEGRVMSSPVQGLQGMIPNLNVSVTNAGGQPGATRGLNVRGTGSINGGSPYVLVDGVPQGLETVNPQDIESISVLKGAAASAIYGSQAPYGVILVTTKKGTSDGMSISYSADIGWNSPTVLPDMANSLEWAQTFNQAFANSGQNAFFSDEQIQRMKDYMADPENTPATIPDPKRPNEWGRYPVANANVDWFDVYYKPQAMNQTHNLSVGGGGEEVTYYLSGGFFDQSGQFRYGDDRFQRYNMTANIQSDITDWMGVDVNTRFTNRNTDMPYTYGQIGSYYHDIARKWPNVPAVDPNGNLMMNGIAFNAKGGRNIDNENQFVGSVAFDIQPLNNWDVNADFSYRLNDNSGTTHKKQVMGYRVDETPYPFAGTSPTSYSQYKNESVYRTTNVYTSYQLNPGNHFVKGMVGFQEEELSYSNLSGSKSELVTDEVPAISTATGEDDVNDGKGHWATQGVFMRLNYNYDEKYLIEFNARYDGSSRFAEGDRWGFYPSVSAGYNIANESFWEGLQDEVNLLKVRASYGSLGNHDVPNYLYISTLGINTNLGWMMGDERPIYVTTPGLTSSNLTWETVSTMGLGLDAEMLERRLSLTFDWFQRSTTDMFGPTESFPGVLGTSAPQSNNADLKTQGFELSVGWSDQVGQVQYHVEAQLADHQTTITRYRNETGYLADYYEGQTLGEIWGYTTEGLYPNDEAAQDDPVDQSFFWSTWEAGDVDYKDLNGDGKIDRGNYTLDDHGDLSVIGNSTPRYSYSFDLGVQWKGIDVSTFWQGVAKRDLWLGGNFFWGISGGQWQSSVFEPHLDYWREDNKDGYYPKPYMTGENNKNHQTQTRYLQNGAYLRLKNLQVGYTLPSKWVERVSVKNLRVYFSGENLLTFSPIMEAFDPEAVGGWWGNGKLYPLSTTLSVGVNVSL